MSEEEQKEQGCMGRGCMTRVFQLFHRHRILLNTNRHPNSSSTPTTKTSPMLISPHSTPIQDSTEAARLSHVYLTQPYPDPPQGTPTKNPTILESQEVIMAGLSECLGLLSRLSKSSWVNPNNRESNKHFSSDGREDRRASSVDYKESLINLQKLKEEPRFSLDSKLSSNTAFLDHVATITKAQSSRDKLHQNVVAKLMGLDEIPDRCYSARELSNDTHYAKKGSNNHIINRNRGKSEGSLSKISDSILSIADEDEKGICNSTIYLDSKLNSENQIQSMDSFYSNLDSLLEKEYMTCLKQPTDYRQSRKPLDCLQPKHFSHVKQKLCGEEETKLRRTPIITNLRRTEKSRKVAPIVTIEPVRKRNLRILQFTEAEKPYTALVSESIRSIETSNKKGKKALHIHHLPCNKEKISKSQNDSSKKCTKASSSVREFRNATDFTGRCQANANNSRKSKKPESRSHPIMHKSYTKPSQNDPVENWNEKAGSIVDNSFEAENTEQPSPISVLQISFSSNESYQLPNSDHNTDYSGSRTIDSTSINSDIVPDYHHSETEVTEADCNNNSHSERLEYKQDRSNPLTELGLSVEEINLASKVLASIDRVFPKLNGKHSLQLNNSSEEEENCLKKPEAKDEWIRSLLYDAVNEILTNIFLKRNQPWPVSFDRKRGNINDETPESLLIKEVLEELDNLQCMPSEEITDNPLILIKKDLAHTQNERSECMQKERGEISMELECLIFKNLIDEIVEDLIQSQQYYICILKKSSALQLNHSTSARRKIL